MKMWWIMIFMANYILSIIYPFDHNCITSMVLPTFLFQNNYSIIVALRTKRKIFSYKIQKPLLKRNLKKDA